MPTKIRKSVDQPHSSTEQRSAHAVTELGLILLLTLVAAIRLYKLGEWSFWVDEMFTMRDALDESALFHNFTYPLSYMIIGATMKLYGISEFTARIAPAVVGILTPGAIYLLARRDFGRTPALIAAGLIAISPWHLYWSQMSRFYTMTMLFSAMAALLFYSGVERNSPWRMAGAVVAMILAVMSHYSAFLVLAGLIVYTGGIYILKWPQRDGPTGSRKKALLAFFLPFMVAGLAMVPKVAYILYSYSMSHATTGTSFSNPAKGAIYVAFSTFYRVEFAVAGAAVLTAIYLFRRRDRRGLFLAAMIVVPMLLMIVAGALSRGENRYLLVTLPAFALLAGIGVAIAYDAVRLHSRALAAVLPIVIALPLIQHSATYFSSLSGGERWDYRAAAELIRQDGQAGDTVLTAMDMPLHYYLDDSGIVVMGLKPPRMKDYLDMQKRLWFVMEDQTRGESASVEVKDWVHRNCDLIATFPATSPVANYGVSVYLYVPPE